MKVLLSIISIRPQCVFVLFSLLIPLFTTGCATIKGISMMRGGSTEQSMLMRDESVTADHLAHFLTVKARINGSPDDLNFLVDTGALTVIDEQTAKRFTFNDSVNIEIKDAASNKKEAPLVQVNQISVGNILVSNCAAAVIDLKKYSPKIDGILGSNFLKHFKVQLDYQNSRVTFLSISGTQATGDSMAIPVWKNMKFGFAPTMECELDGAVTVDCMIDTGHDAIASIPLSIIQKLPHFKSGEFIRSNGVMGGGVFGKDTESYLIKTDRIVSGPLIIDNVSVATNNFGDLMTLGSAYLKNFLVTIDYPNSVLYLKPYSNHQVDTKKLSFGFALSKEKDKTVVSGIWKGSMADKAGLLVGDELISLNGQKTTSLPSFDIMELMNSSEFLKISYVKQTTGNSSEITLHKADLTLISTTSSN